MWLKRYVHFHGINITQKGGVVKGKVINTLFTGGAAPHVPDVKKKVTPLVHHAVSQMLKRRFRQGRGSD